MCSISSSRRSVNTRPTNRGDPGWHGTTILESEGRLQPEGSHERLTMRQMPLRRFVAPLLLTLATACAGLGSQCGEGTANSTGMTIAVIPKGTTHTFWQSIRAGAERAGKELGATISWRGPLREDDRDSQVSEVEGFVSRGVSGIVLAPLDEAALM